MITSPFFILAIASSNSFPLVTGTNFTGCPSNSSNLLATGAKLFFARSASSLIRPR